MSLVIRPVSATELRRRTELIPGPEINDADGAPVRFDVLMDWEGRVTVGMNEACTLAEILDLCIMIAYACREGLDYVTFCRQ